MATSNLAIPQIPQVDEKVYKTTTYTRRAITNYHNKHKDDPEYKQKRAVYSKDYYEKNKEKNKERNTEKNFPIINIIDLLNN